MLVLVIQFLDCWLSTSRHGLEKGSLPVGRAPIQLLLLLVSEGDRVFSTPLWKDPYSWASTALASPSWGTKNSWGAELGWRFKDRFLISVK